MIFISCRKWGRKTSSRPLFVFQKVLYKTKASVPQLGLTISIALKLAYNKNKQYKTLNYWSRGVLNFDFLEKDLGKVSPPHFVYDFSKKMFLILYSVNWPNLISSLPFFLKHGQYGYCNYLLTRLWRHKI